MALSVSKGSEHMPKDAVLLDREQALRYQMILVKKWEPKSDAYGLRFGPAALAVVGGISGIAVLAHFRKKLKLGVYGKVTSYFPGVVLPSALSALLHSIMVQNKILLSEYDCPLCLHTRAAAIQVATSVVYPFLLAPMATFFFATRHFTVRLPYITEEPKAWLKLYIKLMRSGKRLAGYCLAANMIGAYAITQLEFKQYFNIQCKLEEFEKQVESGSVLNY